jgi:hypothetical protein
MFKEILEVATDRNYNDKAIKALIKEIRNSISDMEKRLAKIEKGQFDDKKANSLRGSLKVANDKIHSSDIPSI